MPRARTAIVKHLPASADWDIDRLVDDLDDVSELMAIELPDVEHLLGESATEFGISVACTSRAEQQSLLARLTAEGFACNVCA